MVSMAAPTTRSPCAACKFLRRKCQPDCVFAPYFPPDQPQKFTHVHRVFGASNVTKLLNEVHPCQREDAVNSLAYEADMRLRDPVYGCAGVISLLQHQLRQLQLDLALAHAELSKFHQQYSAARNGFIDVNLPVGFGFGRFDLSLAVSTTSQHQHSILRNDFDHEDADHQFPAAAKSQIAPNGACDDTGRPASLSTPAPAMGEQLLFPAGMAAGGEKPAIAPL
ncbi:LOB domain-containing protein 6 [Canna indica]|uniref:LOB domain-containing protein 6 n=1 Tax=Canna indica TaxID=4628 RepID=A0AAQ3JWM0_9LILI|nr:LOB domain-containing protein 6 [Canna indica]